MEKKILFLLSSIFLAVGTGLLLGAGHTYRSNAAFDAEAIAAEGTVVDLASYVKEGSTFYRPVVEFTDRQGRTIRISGSSASTTPSHRRGDRLEVRYPPQAPEEARLETWSDRWFGIALLGGMGIVFAGVGTSLVIVALRIRPDAAEPDGAASGARTDGFERPEREAVDTRRWRSVEAKVVSVERSDDSFERRGWQIVAQWQDPKSGLVHVFESEEIPYDPSDYALGRKIPVRVDPNDPESYEVDLSSLPQAG
jgi:hypothetical protein